MKQKYDVIIIGAGLTGLTTAFYLTKQGKKVAVLEKDSRLGGQIQTFTQEGFIFEKGPNTGVISYPEVAELFQDLYPLCQIETAKEEAKRRLIWKKNKFHEIPSSLWGGITTPLFSFKDKFRILGEPFRPKGTNPHESVASITRRRLGNSYLDYAVNPFLSGVYAGNPETLITKYALPKLYNLEQEYGSFIKGAIAKSKAQKTNRDRLATKQVFSVKGGLENMIQALARKIGAENIFTNAKDLTIQPTDGEWTITLNQDQSLKSTALVTTTGAYALADLLPFIDSQLLRKITSLKYAPVIQISVGVKDTESLKFNAFGGLVPSCENKQVLGILFPSACFDNRAPKDGALFSFFIGGVQHMELTQLSDDDLKTLVIHNFHEMLKFPKNKKPDLIHIFRHPQAIPQYEVNSGERFATINHIESLFPGLIIGGNAKGGIGMADRIKQGVEIAKRLTPST